MSRQPLLSLIGAVALAAACESHPNVTFRDDDAAGPFTILYTAAWLSSDQGVWAMISDD